MGQLAGSGFFAQTGLTSSLPTIAGSTETVSSRLRHSKVNLYAFDAVTRLGHFSLDSVRPRGLSLKQRTNVASRHWSTEQVALNFVDVVFGN